MSIQAAISTLTKQVNSGAEISEQVLELRMMVDLELIVSKVSIQCTAIQHYIHAKQNAPHIYHQRYTNIHWDVPWPLCLWRPEAIC